MSNKKNCIETFLKIQRVSLVAHLESGYIDYARDGYLSIIKIIENELKTNLHDKKKLEPVVLELAEEINKFKNILGDNIFDSFFYKSTSIKSILKNNNYNL